MSKIKIIEMDGVREYSEEMGVELTVVKGKYREDRKGKRRIVIKSYNEGGYNHTQIDLEDLIDWIDKNKLKVEALEKEVLG